MRRMMSVRSAAWMAAAVVALLACAVPASAQRRVIRPEGAPTDRPYSPGVLVGQTLYISGQLGLPGTGPTPAAMDVQARQAMDGVGAVLKAAGLGYQHLVKCHVYLANMDDYAAMNAVYGSYFTDRVPARTTVQAVALPAGAGIQIACIGYADLARHLRRAPAAGIAAGAARSVFTRRVGRRHALRLGHGRPGSGDQGGGGVGRGAGHADRRQHHDDAEGRRSRRVRRRVGAGICHARSTRRPPSQATLAKAVDAPRGLVVVPRLPGPIRAELTFIATRPSVSGTNFGTAGGIVGGPATSTDGPTRGVRRGSTVYVDAVIGTGDDVDAQARQAFARLGALLQAGGVGLQDVAVVTVYLTDMADLPRMNTIFKETFPTDPPARVTIQVQPQAKERIRIGLIAVRPARAWSGAR